MYKHNSGFPHVCKHSHALAAALHGHGFAGRQWVCLQSNRYGERRVGQKRYLPQQHLWTQRLSLRRLQLRPQQLHSAWKRRQYVSNVEITCALSSDVTLVMEPDQLQRFRHCWQPQQLPPLQQTQALHGKHNGVKPSS